MDRLLAPRRSYVSENTCRRRDSSPCDSPGRRPRLSVTRLGSYAEPRSPADHPIGPCSLVLRKLKGTTVRHANKLLIETGQSFWQDESYDHLVRSAEEFQRIGNYIVSKPGSGRTRRIGGGISMVEHREEGRSSAPGRMNPVPRIR